MKRTLLSFILMLSILSIAHAYVNVEQPQNIDVSITQTFKIDVSTNESMLDFSVVIPKNVQVQNYKLTGIENYNSSSNDVVYLEKASTAYLWSFRNLTANNFEIEFTVSSKTAEKMYSVWIYPPTNFDSKTITLSVGKVESAPNNVLTYVMMLIILIVAAILVYYLIVAYKQHSRGYGKV
jgi:hypothetical protein